MQDRAVMVLLVLGAVPGLSVSAGAAMVGAAATRSSILAGSAGPKPRRQQRAAGETQRPAYMVLAARDSGRRELAATVVNALALHQSAVDPDIAMRHVTAIMNGRDGDTSGSEAWFRGQIARLTGELRTT
jgi:hypothetical protein